MPPYSSHPHYEYTKGKGDNIEEKPNQTCFLKESRNIFQFYCHFLMKHNVVHMACGGFEALSCPPKPNLATERKP